MHLKAGRLLSRTGIGHPWSTAFTPHLINDFTDHTESFAQTLMTPRACILQILLIPDFFLFFLPNQGFGKKKKKNPGNRGVNNIFVHY